MQIKLQRTATNILARKKIAGNTLLPGVLNNKKYRKTAMYRQALADQPVGSFARSHGWRGDYKKLKTI